MKFENSLPIRRSCRAFYMSLN